MSDPSKVLAERGLRPRVRQTLQHAPVFTLDDELPDGLRLLLEQLEQLAVKDVDPVLQSADR